MPALLPNIDPDGLLEFSVVFTDRSLNHMSAQFQGVMKDISTTLKSVYGAQAVAVIPGGGTYAMEAVARQLAQNEKCLVIRNGWFSFRWTQILETAHIASSVTVLKASPTSNGSQAPFTPAPLDEVLAAIANEKPAVVFAPHVETASGMMLSNDYITAVADAVHAVGGLFVLDCIASGAMWVNMADTGVDVLISAPQKGWSASPCSGLVMLSDAAVAKVNATTSSSFSCDLKKWLHIMQAYEQGGHAYHATMPTDSLKYFRDMMKEQEVFGFELMRERQIELGQKVRALLASKGFNSVAAQGFEAPGVAVFYTHDDLIHNGKAFIAQGLQTAAGVPLQCDEPADYKTFRIGLFGIDKLRDVDATVARFELALNALA
jgi:aspartate aminotransferase-like enzyme